ncbi:hypothetical protein PROFUN_08245 [Planoprotostelium fungivorum]|uniref:Uncharacterized protein n=1 Tax=Planoprotostelium fungivorum TaxID=1890364 RepID=A0A2P6NK92_9EUKA|nr:hypothetical protein PROFUN_08245 [Planoprotostelium fungivorum]
MGIQLHDTEQEEGTQGLFLKNYKLPVGLYVQNCLSVGGL